MDIMQYSNPMMIRSIIRIIDTRNDDTDKQYNDWWLGGKDDWFLVNYMHELLEDMMTTKEYDAYCNWCLKATPDETLDYIEQFMEDNNEQLA